METREENSTRFEQPQMYMGREMYERFSEYMNQQGIQLMNSSEAAPSRDNSLIQEGLGLREQIEQANRTIPYEVNPAVREITIHDVIAGRHTMEHLVTSRTRQSGRLSAQLSQRAYQQLYNQTMNSLNRRAQELTPPTEEVHMSHVSVNSAEVMTEERKQQLHRQLASQIIANLPYEEFKKIFQLTVENPEENFNEEINYRVRFKTLRRRIR
jgi:hypothetical protein